MEAIDEIIEQEIVEPLVEETHHSHHRSMRHHQHHHNGSVVMVNTQTGQIIQHQRQELNNNGACAALHLSIMDNFCCHNLILCVELFADSMDHQRGRIITHGGQNTSNLDLIKQEHCGDAVGELGQRGIKLFKQNRFFDTNLISYLQKMSAHRRTIRSKRHCR